jgi:alkylated DNA repair dioxygenase AlkB
MISQIFNDQVKLFYQSNFLKEDLLQNIISEIEWRQDQITMFGKTHPIPRLTAWYGDPNISYQYSNIKMTSTPWSITLLKIKEQLENDHQLKFNSVLLNYYRDGKDHMSFHSDDERELGKNPTIASISLGAKRKFVLKHKFNKSKEQFTIELEDRSLLIMSGELQNFWNHKITKALKENNPRINLTFRTIIKLPH